MKLLPEYTFIHDVLDGDSRDVAYRLCYLRDTLLTDGLVRELRGSEWQQELIRKSQSLSPTVRKIVAELIRSLSKERRLVPHPTPGVLAESPKDAADWCIEALESHRHQPLEAIVSGVETASNHASPVISIEDLPTHISRVKPTHSVHVRRDIAEYILHLSPALRVARRVCFIDPYIDPSHRDYRSFPLLLLELKNRRQKPVIELHRECAHRGKQQTKKDYWIPVFAEWSEQLKKAGLSAKVRIWPDFHNRYFLADVLALQLGHGFGTNPNPKIKDHWSRLSREDRENLDRDFDENYAVDKPWCTFTIGVT